LGPEAHLYGRLSLLHVGVRHMGVVYRPEDMLRGRRAIIEKGLRDASPGVRDIVMKIFEAWEGKPSEERLIELVGEEKAKRLMESLRR